MAAALGGMPITGMYDFSWVGEYATRPQDTEAGSSRQLIVDVGGGKGQALKAILDEDERISAARCVLQDQSDVIREAVQEGDVLGPVKKVAASFFEEQPIKGSTLHQLPFCPPY